MRHWQNLSYQKKNRLLWLGAALFGLLAYRVALAPTVAAYGECQRLTDQLQLATSNPGQVASLRRELRYAEQFLVTRQSDTSRTDALLADLPPLCQRHGVTLAALLPAQTETQENYRVTTRPVRLEGDFVSLVRVIHALENQLHDGRLTSVQFAVREDLLRGHRTLYADCYLQQLREAE